MAGDRTRERTPAHLRGPRAAAFVVAFALWTSCGGGEPVDPCVNETSSDVRREVLRNLGEGQILPLYRDFEAAAAGLEAATSAYASDRSAENLSAAQEAWIAAMDLWQEAELFQIGPAADAAAAAGGLGLRTQIYSWPLVNSCRVDQEITEEAFRDPDAFEAEAVNVRGLDALEYLLFHTATENTCPLTLEINAGGVWAAIPPDQLAERRAAYAHTAAILVHRHATALRAAWDPAGGNFLGALASAGDGSATYASAQEALNALTDALFYVETELKDMKLAEPAGVSMCTDPSGVCPDARESRWAERSLPHMRANLRAYRRAFYGAEPGGEGMGFDDLLLAAGAEALEAQLRADLDAAIAAVEGLGDDLVLALAERPDDTRAAYDAFQIYADRLKSEFLCVLDLDLPRRAEGDND